MLSFYFYFIFKMKQGEEMEKRERRNGRGEQGHILVALEAGLYLVLAVSPTRPIPQNVGTGLSHHLLRTWR